MSDDKLRSAFLNLLSHMDAAASAYRKYARQPGVKGRADPFYTTRLEDFDAAVARHGLAVVGLVRGIRAQVAGVSGVWRDRPFPQGGPVTAHLILSAIAGIGAVVAGIEVWRWVRPRRPPADFTDRQLDAIRTREAARAAGHALCASRWDGFLAGVLQVGAIFAVLGALFPAKATALSLLALQFCGLAALTWALRQRRR